MDQRDEVGKEGRDGHDHDVLIEVGRKLDLFSFYGLANDGLYDKIVDGSI